MARWAALATFASSIGLWLIASTKSSPCRRTGQEHRCRAESGNVRIGRPDQMLMSLRRSDRDGCCVSQDEVRHDDAMGRRASASASKWRRCIHCQADDLTANSLIPVALPASLVFTCPAALTQHKHHTRPHPRNPQSACFPSPREFDDLSIV